MSWLLAGVLSVMVVGVASPAAAQDAPKIEVAGGWNYIGARFNDSEEWQHFYKGGFGEVAVNLNNRWGVVGNIGYLGKTVTEIEGDFKVKVIPYLFGVRASSRTNEKNTPFVHFLVGATRLNISLGSDDVSQTGFTWQGGGGINIKVNDVMGARVGGDYIRVMGKDDGDIFTEAIQGLRLSAGVTFGFGGN